MTTLSTYVPEANEAIALAVKIDGQRNYVIRHQLDSNLKSVIDVARPYERSAKTLAVDFADVETALNWIAEREGVLTPATAKVDDGVTINRYSDRNAGTIIEVRRNGKQIVIQQDKATRTNRDQDTFSPGGFAGHTETPGGQKWAYERDVEGATYTANWSAKRARFFVGGPKGSSVTGGRHEHYDYNF